MDMNDVLFDCDMTNILSKLVAEHAVCIARPGSRLVEDTVCTRLVLDLWHSNDVTRLVDRSCIAHAHLLCPLSLL